MTAALARILPTLVVLSVIAFWGSTKGASRLELADDRVACDLDPPEDAAGLEACLARAPRDVELLLELGVVYEAAGRFADAQSAYQRAVGADPRDGEARLRLAAALRRAGDADGARREGAVALGLRPNDPMAGALAFPEASVSPEAQ